MTAEATRAWDRHNDGQYISVSISWHWLDDVRQWCAENCVGDFVIVLGQRVLFQASEDAALATQWWRREED
ncbi:hypothetical protein GCM10011504_52990 [Siccirubricoccus deserti]|uniref:Uncharacterized protein n=1 Tax=Siccirubricoccus deserti TaxID=2013562 RepID=A0A9X0R305_9PROT|nr:hypothetical protein [Siccirubricoccus deserti]MBC4018809.1 hypothetical protein [Siccirubricoccus deserti]GGC68400.1 hypothetical protein GCM10011504_52990 [Siccirubricoccus deserti]